MADFEDRLRADGEQWRTAQRAPLDVPAALAGRRRQRGPRPAWAVATTAAAVLALVTAVAFAVSRPEPAPPVATPTPSPTLPDKPPDVPGPAPSPEPTPPSYPPPTSPACLPPNLVVEAGSREGIGGGLSGGPMYLLNNGTTACSLTGRPTLTAYTSTGAVAFTVRGGDVDYGFAGPRDIPPGQQAVLWYGIRNDAWCDHPPGIATVELTLSAHGDTMLFDRPGRALCGIVVGRYGSPWTRPPDPDATPMYPGLTARIDVPAQVHPFSRQTYHVVVTNHGADVTFGGCDLEYRTWLNVSPEPVEQRRSAPCEETSQLLRHGASRTFDAVIYVPDRVRGSYTLGWELAGLTATRSVTVGS